MDLASLNYWVVDTEFHAPDGGPITVHCVCGRNISSGEVRKIWTGDGKAAPWRWGPRDTMIAHYSPAELVAFLSLGWPLPPHVIDTLPEWRVATGQRMGHYRLIDVAAAAGVPVMSVEHKEGMRGVAMQPVVPEADRGALMDYCLQDVEATVSAFTYLRDRGKILPQAILRGRYLLALSRVEHRGIPVDARLCSELTERWGEIRGAMAAEAAVRYPGAFKGTTFSLAGWSAWCEGAGIPWPSTPTGRPRKNEDTMKVMAAHYPQLGFMRDTLRLQGATRAVTLAPWADDRIRCMLSPFGSDTGRNQPSNSRFPFGMAAWLRAVVQAPAGRRLAYLDYSAQEFAAAAALSGDPVMRADYLSGDPYLAFGKRVGLIPPGGTKATHKPERDASKTVVLGLQYGMRENTLAGRLGMSVAAARDLLAGHRRIYGRYWEWTEGNLERIGAGLPLTTRFGWERRWKGPRDSATSAGNFPVQATGAEILRLAVVACEEAGLRIVAPVHDAVLLEADTEEEIATARRLMERAAEAVIGIQIRTDREIVEPGCHYADPRGAAVWEFLRGKLEIDYGA